MSVSRLAQISPILSGILDSSLLLLYLALNCHQSFRRGIFSITFLSTLGVASTVDVVVVDAYQVVTGTITTSRAEERAPKIER